MKTGFVIIVFCLFWVLPVDLGALTVEEILLLKQNGVSEQTIQMMLESEMRAGSDPSEGDKIGVRTITRPGGQPAIVYSTGTENQYNHDEAERLKEKRAWEMLRHIIVDTRRMKD